MLVLTAQFALLAAVVGTAAAFVVSQKSITVVVDGQPSHVHSFDGSVRSILTKAHIQLGEHDTVTPNLSAHVGDHGTVTVGRGRLIDLELDGTMSQRWVTASTVQGALDELGLAVAGEYVSVPPSTGISLNGAAFTVRRPQVVHVLVDGVDKEIVTTEPTVAAVLATNDVVLGDLDRLSVVSTQYPTTGLAISITRVSAKQEVTSQPVARTVQRVADDTLYVGTTRTIKAGQDGVLVSVYSATYTDGQLSDRILTDQHLTAEPQPTVVAYGTKPVPPAALNWNALAMCESRGNPRSVSAGGLYRGLYQFTLGSWAGVGGSGDPIDASPQEQTYRAQLLYQARGRAPWPVCGKLL